MIKSDESISIVIPVYKCFKSLIELHDRLSNVLAQLTLHYEIIFVNDRSPEEDWKVIREISESSDHVKGINLSRNFGQHYAILAGLSFCNSDWIVVMDGDLQDRPEEIEKLFRKAKQGFDIVLARRVDRKDKFLKKMFSKLFYKVLGYLTDSEQDPTIANFGIYSRKVISSVLGLGDKHVYFPAMIKWVGFKSTSINVDHSERIYGETSYSIRGLLQLAFNTILSFSDKPLRLTIKIGLIISLVSAFFAIIYFIQAILGYIIVEGWASLIISIWFLGGINIAFIGIVGSYIGKIFDSVKNRPNFLVDEVI